MAMHSLESKRSLGPEWFYKSVTCSISEKNYIDIKLLDIIQESKSELGVREGKILLYQAKWELV